MTPSRRTVNADVPLACYTVGILTCVVGGVALALLANRVFCTEIVCCGATWAMVALSIQTYNGIAGRHAREVRDRLNYERIRWLEHALGLPSDGDGGGDDPPPARPGSLFVLDRRLIGTEGTGDPYPPCR